MKEEYDFGGWATKNDLLCQDGRTIRKNAFKHDDGKTVPLVWNHRHTEIENVLGHALLENRENGVYAYCKLNDSERGKLAKHLLERGDISKLSIYANQLKHSGMDVLSGSIREVSLVISGSNPGAGVQEVIRHGDVVEDEAIIFPDESDGFILHSDLDEDDESKEPKEYKESKKDDEGEDEKTIASIVDTFTDEQKQVFYALVGMALEEGDPDDDDEKDDDEKEVQHNEGGNENMKKNVFDKEDTNRSDVLCHSDQEAIVKLAKTNSVGTLKAAMEIYTEENALAHADTATSSGFAQEGEGNVTTLFPDYKDVRPGAPELITHNQAWVKAIMAKVHKCPMSRIRTRHVDIRNINELRAKGYKKGSRKVRTGNFNLVNRTTDAQTVYVSSALNRDDIMEITDFDYVQYLYHIDRVSLEEEMALGIMIGDGRDIGASDKIHPDHIRPIWTDDDLFTIHADLDIAKAKTELQGTNTGASFGENYVFTEAMISTATYATEQYRGSGDLDFYCTPHTLNKMLLARDMNGRRIYSSKAELATVLGVHDIYTVEQFTDKVRTTEDNKKKKLVGILVNMNDYAVGATKGGELTHFTQFDIDFNQLKSLLETRSSGALTRVYSAIVIEEDVTSKSTPAYNPAE